MPVDVVGEKDLVNVRDLVIKPKESENFVFDPQRDVPQEAKDEALKSIRNLEDLARFNYIDSFYELCSNYARLFPEERNKLQLKERHKRVYLIQVGSPGTGINIDKIVYLARCSDAIALDPDLRYELPTAQNERYKQECLELLQEYTTNHNCNSFLLLSEKILSVYPETRDKVIELTEGVRKFFLGFIKFEKEKDSERCLFYLARLRVVNPQIFDESSFTSQDFQKARE